MLQPYMIQAYLNMTEWVFRSERLWKDEVDFVETKLLYSVTEGAQRLGIGRSMMYELLARGEVAAVKIGRRTLIADTELVRYVATLRETAA